MKCSNPEPPKTSVDCLRQIDPMLIVNNRYFMSQNLFIAIPVWLPIVDGKIIVEQPVSALRQGKAEVPVIFGDTKNEGWIFLLRDVGQLPPAPPIYSAKRYKATVFSLWKRRAVDKIFSNPDYAPNVGGENEGKLGKLLTDAWFVCPNRYGLSGPNTIERWAYRFEKLASFVFPYSPACAKGVVCHGSDLPYWFGSFNQSLDEFKVYPGSPKPPNQPELRLSAVMNRFLGCYARTSDPNGAGGCGPVPWPNFTSQENLRIGFASKLSLIQDYSGANCELWDEIGYVDNYIGWSPETAAAEDQPLRLW